MFRTTSSSFGFVLACSNDGVSHLIWPRSAQEHGAENRSRIRQRGYAVGTTRSDTSRGRQSLWKSFTHNFETLPSTMWVVRHETSGQRIVVAPSMSYIAFISEPQLHVQTTTDCIAILRRSVIVPPWTRT